MAPPLATPDPVVPKGKPPISYRWGWRAFAAFVAGGVLTAGGFAAALVATDYGDDSSVLVAADGTTPVIVADADADPASIVAEILGPSVVQIETDIGLGSGIHFRDDLVVTNHHVIADAGEIAIRLFDGRFQRAELVGSDPRTDVAVLRVPTGIDVPVARLAADTPKVGELTVAIGSPFQLQQTVTSGIVSAVNRPIFDGANWNAMIQTDAAINPGNSGGALANRQGEIIGINTSIQTDGNSASNAGVGFAMPISTVQKVADRILSGETLDPGFLGVEGTNRPPSGNRVGVELESVQADSAAAEAGLLEGDVVTSLNGAPVTSFIELAGLIQTAFPGEEVVLEVLRNGEVKELTVTLGTR